MTFGLMVWAVQAGLLGDPQMSIQGPDCWDQHLRFFVDRSEGELPTATLLTLPVWVFRALMFVWALWLAVSLVKWARWGWGSFKDGGLFRPEGAPPRHRHFGHARGAAAAGPVVVAAAAPATGTVASSDGVDAPAESSETGVAPAESSAPAANAPSESTERSEPAPAAEPEAAPPSKPD